MNESRPPTGSRSVRQPVLLGLFAGVAVGVGYLLAGVPGVELMTLVTALDGVALGARPGAAVGGLAALVMSYKGNSTPKPQLEEDITKAEWVPMSKIDKITQNTYPSIKEVLSEINL